MMRQVFTFGSGQRCECGNALHHNYVVIEAECPRDEMVSVWENKWSFEYDSETEAGVEKYKLTPIPFRTDANAPCRCKGSSLVPLKSVKARAWSLAAGYLLDLLLDDDGIGLDSETRDHIIMHVVPAMKRRAEIIERNAR